MRIAIIDCGTNTFHLMIVDIASADHYKKIFRTKIAVKLGEAGITSSLISELAFQRGIKAIEHFAEKIESYKVDSIYAYATAALRNAKNGIHFIEEAESKTGIKIKLITGKREAELIYFGVREAIKLGTTPSLIMDIGGGSVELVICNNKKIFWKHSYSLGAALLLEKIKPDNPISNEQIKKLNRLFNSKLSQFINACSKYKPGILIGSSGSFDTFAELIEHRNGKALLLGRKTSYEFEIEKYRIIHQLLVKSTIEQRIKMKGLVSMRVDMIVLASLLLTFVLNKTAINKMTLSTYALKEGILFDIIKP